MIRLDIGPEIRHLGVMSLCTIEDLPLLLLHHIAVLQEIPSVSMSWPKLKKRKIEVKQNELTNTKNNSFDYQEIFSQLYAFLFSKNDCGAEALSLQPSSDHLLIWTRQRNEK